MCVCSQLNNKLCKSRVFTVFFSSSFPSGVVVYCDTNKLVLLLPSSCRCMLYVIDVELFYILSVDVGLVIMNGSKS